jgi:hypothetical protein
MAKETAKKNHGERKDPGMADKFRNLRRETNALRPKQRWVGEHANLGQAAGHWER